MSKYLFDGASSTKETAVGFSGGGEDALYTCPHCPGLHRKFEICPTKEGTLGMDHPVDTGDPWDHPSDGNPPYPQK